MNVTLKQMRYVVALADTGRFRKAAERCHVTQSALSQQIKQVEEMSGALVFHRSEAGARPTPFGREFVERARAILHSAEMLDRFATQHGGRPQRPISFGLIPTVAPYLLAEVYPLIRDAVPEISITVSESRTEHLLAQLHGGTLDIGLIATPLPAGSQLIEMPIMEDPFVAAVPKDNPVTGPLSLSTLEPEDLLLLDEGHCLRDQAMDACALSKGEIRRAFAATSLSTIVECVANGQGVTLLPSISLKKEAADPRIRIVALASPGARRTLSLVWHRGSPFSSVFETVAGAIKQGAESLGARSVEMGQARAV